MTIVSELQLAGEYKRGGLTIPMLLYAVVITTMLWRASARVGAPGISEQSGWSGLLGAAGRVEGIVRRLVRYEESDQLQPGEILVAVTTNVGWTPLFPRAAAVITDVGVPLSHAAIVARELGIPAVVGCVDATTRLKTGDRVRVDGGRGIVEILQN
jgi:pyruvate,water dikinase